jgi:chromosome partitioning protein
VSGRNTHRRTNFAPSGHRGVVPSSGNVISVRITVGNLKGGSSKTTTSVYLALGLARQGHTLLVDTDPDQPSALRWSELAGNQWPQDCSVVAVNTRRLYPRLEQLANDYQHIVVDTGPKNPLMLRQAMAFADQLVVPVAPRPLDLAEVPKTFGLATEVATTSRLLSSVLLVQVRAGTRSAADTRALLDGEWGLPVLNTQTPLRESFALAYGTAPANLAEYADVLSELQKKAIADES